jgi:2-polyprenyl-3-methyl-5-hydroxy-6-metoxy-1,4-benzoquinol methylase
VEQAALIADELNLIVASPTVMLEAVGSPTIRTSSGYGNLATCLGHPRAVPCLEDWRKVSMAYAPPRTVSLASAVRRFPPFRTRFGQLGCVLVLDVRGAYTRTPSVVASLSMLAVIRARRAHPDELRVDACCNLCREQRAGLLYTKGGFELVRCVSCGLVYVRNPPTRDDLHRQYSFAAGYHTVFRSDDSAESRAHAARSAEFLRIVRRHSPPGRILDVGCSVGFFLERAQADRWTTVGVELSNDTAELARRKGLEVFTGTLDQAAFPPASFDVVTMWDVVEHLDDPVATVATAADVLKRDGVLALSTPNVEGIFPRLSYRAARWTGRWPHPEPPSHLFQFSKTTISQLLQKTGLEPIEILDRRIPLSYTFGDRSLLLREPKRLAYATVFAPLAFLAPLVHSGDDMVVVARKRA